jgi:hypothetical protein
MLNKEEKKKHAKEYYEANKERFLKNQRKYNKEHPYKYKEAAKLLLIEDIKKVRYMFESGRALDIADVLELTGWDTKRVLKVCSKIHKNWKWCYDSFCRTK